MTAARPRRPASPPASPLLVWLVTQRGGTCANGHAYTPDSTYVDPHGWRRCRRCARASRARQARRGEGA